MDAADLERDDERLRCPLMPNAMQEFRHDAQVERDRADTRLDLVRGLESHADYPTQSSTQTNQIRFRDVEVRHGRGQV